MHILGLIVLTLIALNSQPKDSNNQQAVRLSCSPTLRGTQVSSVDEYNILCSLRSRSFPSYTLSSIRRQHGRFLGPLRDFHLSL